MNSENILSRLGKRELSFMAVVFAILACVWGFVELADEVVEGSTAEFDETILLAMRSAGDVTDPLGPGWFEEVMRDLTALGGNVVLTLVTLTVVGYVLLCGYRRLAFVVLLASLGGLGMNTLMKNSFERDRPELVPHGSQVYTASFPSGHSMVAASTYLTLAVLMARAERRRRIKVYGIIVAMALTALVGISRVYLGVHWPTDVLAGWAAGAGWAMACGLIALWLQRHGQVEVSPAESGVNEVAR
ncbi:phosphatase PAP2 family protein [Gilvimarinus chinensis]|uniref:phosphatase PAP2 family protein n=1 Tax=Gilvimarinus chinensis TaxID=396005 RepID=UPI00036C8D41|nr:phosphatase PAP2 family protein [Gilvimarinus chinensis]